MPGADFITPNLVSTGTGFRGREVLLGISPIRLYGWGVNPSMTKRPQLIAPPFYTWRLKYQLRTHSLLASPHHNFCLFLFWRLHWPIKRPKCYKRAWQAEINEGLVAYLFLAAYLSLVLDESPSRSPIGKSSIDEHVYHLYHWRSMTDLTAAVLDH